MRIAVGSDHAGFHLKEHVRQVLEGQGHDVMDVGTVSPDSVDYPRYAEEASRLVAEGDADRAVLACGSGVGVSIVANKITGVRAALAHDEVTARRSREHNHCNVLCLGTDLLSEDQIRQIVEIFLGTAYVPGRHDRRVEKIKQLEREVAGAATVSPAPSSSAAGN